MTPAIRRFAAPTSSRPGGGQIAAAIGNQDHRHPGEIPVGHAVAGECRQLGIGLSEIAGKAPGCQNPPALESSASMASLWRHQHCVEIGGG